jgi:hypothetical protein
MPGFSKWSFLSGFMNKSYTYFVSPCMLHTPHIVCLIPQTIFFWRVEIMNLFIVYSSSFPCYLSLLGPDIILTTLISNTFNVCSSHIVRDQVSLPYKTTFKVIVLCILIFTFLGSKLFGRWFWTKWWEALCCCWFLSECNFDMSEQIVELFPHFQRIYYVCLCVVFMKQTHIFSILNIYFWNWSLWCVCCDPIN